MPPRALLTNVSCACIVLAACAHEGAAAPRAARSSGAHSAPAQPAKPKAPAEPATAYVPLDAYMPEHFAIITWARDSVINGELDPLREPLRALSTYEYPDLEPGAWLSSFAQIQQIARVGADATTLPLAASAVAAMAWRCGDCHWQMGQDLDRGPLEPYRDFTRPETFQMRMQRHIWAADRMWEGLVMPSERAWVEGARALANAPSELPEVGEPISPDVANALTELRVLGARALDAQSWEARVESYGQLLSSCSACHHSNDEAP